jgi:hypothetical protein
VLGYQVAGFIQSYYKCMTSTIQTDYMCFVLTGSTVLFVADKAKVCGFMVYGYPLVIG